MMTYTLNNEKKAMRELNLDEMETVSGGSWDSGWTGFGFGWLFMGIKIDSDAHIDAAREYIVFLEKEYGKDVTYQMMLDNNQLYFATIYYNEGVNQMRKSMWDLCHSDW